MVCGCGGSLASPRWVWIGVLNRDCEDCVRSAGALRCARRRGVAECHAGVDSAAPDRLDVAHGSMFRDGVVVVPLG